MPLSYSRHIWLALLLAVAWLPIVLAPSGTVLAQDSEDSQEEVESQDPVAGKLPIEEAMREYNARHFVVSQTDITDPNDRFYDPTILGSYHEWPNSRGCSGGEDLETPPKPEDGWYGPAAYSDPAYATYLVQRIVLAFYNVEPVANGGPLYSYFIDPDEAIDGNPPAAVALTEDDFPLTWMSGTPTPVWSTVGVGIDEIVTVENYEEVLDIILAYIRKLGATGLGDAGGTSNPLQKWGNGDDSLLDPPPGTPPTLEEAWVEMAAAFGSNVPAAPSFGNGVMASYSQNGIGHLGGQPLSSILVGYTELISDVVLFDAVNHVDETAIVFIKVEAFHPPNLGPHIPGMLQLVGDGEYGEWTHLSGADRTIDSGDLVNDDLTFELPLSFSNSAPPPPSAQLGTGLFNDTYGWELTGIVWLVSQYPPIDTSPTPADEEEEDNNDGRPGGGGAPDTDLSDDGEPEVAVDAGNTDEGSDTGDMVAEVDEPRDDIGDPSSLTENLNPAVDAPGSNRVIRDSSGQVLQILNGEYNTSASSPSDHRVHSLVHIDPIPATNNSYAVEYYTDAHWDSTNSDWDPQGDVFRRVSVEDTSSGTDGTSFRITDESFDGQTSLGSCVTEYDWDATNGYWVMSEGVVNGVATRKRWVEIDESDGFKTVTRVITEDNVSNAASKVEEDFRRAGDAWLLVERRNLAASDGTNPDTYASIESWTYTSAGDVQTYRHSNGYWEHHLYDENNGRLVKTITPLGDGGIYDPLDPSSEVDHLVLTQRRQTDDLDDGNRESGYQDTKVEAIQEYIEWIEDPANPGTLMAVGTTYLVTWSFDTNPSLGDPEYEVWEVVCATPDPKAGYAGADDEAKTVAFLNAMAADADYLGHRVTRTVYAAPSEGSRFMIKEIYYPDGTVSTRSKTPGLTRTRTIERGYPVFDANGDVVDIAHGSRTTTTIDTVNHTESVELEQRVRGGSWVTTSLSRSTAADDRGRITSFEYFYGSNAATPGVPDYTSSLEYGHEGLVSRTDQRGLKAEYTYNCLGWMATSTVNVGTSGAMRLGYFYDAAGRVASTTSQGLDAQGVAMTSTRTDISHVYDLAGRVLQSTDAAGVDAFATFQAVNADGTAYNAATGSPGDTYYQELRTYPNDPSAGPIVVTHANRLGQVVLRYEAELDQGATDWTTNPNGRPTGTESLIPLSRVTYAYDWRGVRVRERVYFSLANLSGLDDEGTLGTHYIQSEVLAVDFAGRILREKDAQGTINAAMYGPDDRMVEAWRGTDDTGATPSDPTGGGSGGNNMRKVAQYYYDDDRDGTGDPVDYLTRTEYLRPLATLAGDATDYTGVDFELRLNADDQVFWNKPDHGPWLSATETYDERVLESVKTQNGSEINLLSRSTWHYDTAGKPWRLTATRVYSVVGFAAGDYLETTFEYDDAERQVREYTAQGGFHATEYDDRGRIDRLLFHSDANTVLTQSDLIYDEADRLVVLTELSRHHDDTTTVGPLSPTNSVREIMVSRYDSGGRKNREIDFGQDNGSTRYVYDAQGALIDADSDGIPDEADPDADNASRPRNPDTSDDYRVALTLFDERGQTLQVTVNDGIKRRYTYNAAGWQVRTIENYVNGVAGGGTNNEEDRITQNGYNAFGQLTTVESVLPAGTIENTRYVYASELDDKGGPVADNSALRAIIRADSDDSVANGQLADNAGGYLREEYTYNADGSPQTYKDRREVVWTSVFTDAGYMDHRRVSTIGPNWTAVGDLRIGYTYGDAGEQLTATGYSDAAGTTPTSKVTYTYDGFYNRLTDAQNHNPGALGGGTNLTATYGYDTTATGGQYTNGYRFNQLTYANGRVVKLAFDGHNGIDDATSRPNGIVEVIGGVDTDVARFAMTGNGSWVRKDYTVPSVRLDFVDESGEGTSTGDPYDASTSRFGQVTRLQWERYDSGTGDGSGDIFRSTFDHNRVGQKRYDRRHVYAAYSATYEQDGLRRLVSRDVGTIKVDGQGDVILINGVASVEAFWQVNGQDTTMDQLGNVTSIDTESSTNRGGVAVNDASEITTSISDATAQIDESRVDFNNSSDKDLFTESVNCNLSTDVAVNSGVLTISAGSATAPAVILTGEDRGPIPFSTSLQSPASTGLVGLVFGYKSPLDYWVLAINFAVGDGDWEVYHIHDDDSSGTIDYTDPDEKELVGTYNYDHTTLNQWYTLYARADSNAVDVFRTAFGLSEEGGFPSGRYGLYTEVSNAKFDYFRVLSDGRTASLGAAWETAGNNAVYNHGGTGDGKLWTSGTWHRHYQPVLLRSVRAQRFQATFLMQRSSGSDYAYGLFVFNYRGPGEYDVIRLRHQATAVAPEALSFRNGGTVYNMTENRDAGEVPPCTNDSDPLWYRVVSDGVDVKVFAAVDESGLDTKQSADQWCMRTTASTDRFAFSDGPGRFGFAGASYHQYWDNFKLESDPDNNASLTNKSSYERVEFEDNLDLTSGKIETTFEYDANGNLTYDGTFRYVYDAVNRLMEARAPGSSAAVPGSVLRSYRYDALGRMIEEKQFTSEGVQLVVRNVYDGWNIIETRDAAVKWRGGRVTSQNIWDSLAGHYIDSLAQVAHNLNPGFDEDAGTIGTQDLVDARLYILQDQQANITGAVNVRGTLVERYEYGQSGKCFTYQPAGADYARFAATDLNNDGWVSVLELDILIANFNDKVTPGDRAKGDANGDGVVNSADLDLVLAFFGSSGGSINDKLAMAPAGDGCRMDFGLGSGLPLMRHRMQGHVQDTCLGLAHMRTRVLVTTGDASGGRFLQQDPAGDVDGQNLYVGHFLQRGGTDPLGQANLYEEGLDALGVRLPSAIRSRDKRVDSFIRSMAATQRQVDAKARVLGAQLQLVQDRHGNCPIEAGPFIPLVDEIERSLYSWLRHYETLYELLADGKGNAAQQEEANRLGLPRAFKGLPPEQRAEFTQRMQVATFGLADALASEVGDLDRAILWLERAQVAANAALLVCGAGTATVAITAAARAGGARAAGGTVACLGVKVLAGVAASRVARYGVSRLDLDPYAEEALNVGLDFTIGILASRIKACFPPGTIVWVVDETTGELIPIPIEEVQAGQRVWSYDPDTSEWEACVVEEMYEILYDGEFVDVTYMVDGMGPFTETVSATGNHPFWVQVPALGNIPLTDRPLALHHTGLDADYLGPNGGRWVQARHLMPGDQLLLQNGTSATICRLTVCTELTYVYNLAANRLHNYTVGLSGVCVHNNCQNRGPNGGRRNSADQARIDAQREARRLRRERRSREQTEQQQSGEGYRDLESARRGPQGQRPQREGGRNRERNVGIDEEHSRVPKGRGGQGAN